MHRRLGFRSIRLEMPPRAQWEEDELLAEEPTVRGIARSTGSFPTLWDRNCYSCRVHSGRER